MFRMLIMNQIRNESCWEKTTPEFLASCFPAFWAYLSIGIVLALFGFRKLTFTF